MSQSAERGAEIVSTWKEWLAERNLQDLLALPPSVLGREWAPSEEDRAAAWDLYAEIRTRITTQPLHYRSGDEKTALKSLFELFGTTRDLLHRYQRKCSHFAILSVFMLNGTLRPFTAKWHKLSEAGQLGNEDACRTFRGELLVLQRQLTRFQTLLGHLAENDGFLTGSESGFIPGGAAVVELGPDLAPQALLGKLDPKIWASEQEEIVKRRKLVLGQEEAQATNLVGLAISGGGIRSATFALGVVQCLAEKELLAEVDYLSTVSGGGYLGSFLSTYLNSKDAEVGPRPDQLPFRKPAQQSEAAPVRHLRNHSKYLIEGTWFNHLRSIGQAAYGVLTNLLIVLPFVVLLACLTAWCWGSLLANDEFQVLWTGTTPWAIGVVGVLALGLGVMQNLARNGPRWRTACEWYESLVVVALLVVAAMLAFDLLPAAFASYRWLTGAMKGWAQMGLSLVTPTVLGALVVATKRYPGWSRWLMRLFWLSGPIALLAFYFNLAEWLAAAPMETLRLTVAGSAAVVCYCFLFLNINMTSPHAFYRKQLASAYLLQPGDPGPPKPNEALKLSLLGASAKAPYHLINGALNLSTSGRIELRGRDSDFFLFSKHYCGSPILGYFPTTEWESLDGHLNLGTAMAVSGAAAAPIMGMTSIFGSSFMLTVLNVRLSYWLRNPGRQRNLSLVPTALSGPGPCYLLREMLGRTDETTAYVNVSDGGHLENLGVYELLRRRCKFIVAIDGECDPGMTFGSLIQVIRFAHIDFGIRIDIDLGDLRLGASGFSKSHYAMGTIDYGQGERGFLLYIKSSLTGNEPGTVLSYHANQPGFPHESTAQQLYSEERFEAYRATGHHAASELFRPELMGSKLDSKSKTKDWFQALAHSLLQ